MYEIWEWRQSPTFLAPRSSRFGQVLQYSLVQWKWFSVVSFCGHLMHLSYMHQWCQSTNFIAQMLYLSVLVLLFSSQVTQDSCDVKHSLTEESIHTSHVHSPKSCTKYSLHLVQSTSRHTNAIMLYAVKCSLYVVGQFKGALPRGSAGYKAAEKFTHSRLSSSPWISPWTSDLETHTNVFFLLGHHEIMFFFNFFSFEKSVLDWCSSDQLCMSAVQCLRRGGWFSQFVKHLLRIEQKRQDGLACDEEPLCLYGSDSSDGRSELDGESEVSDFPGLPRRSTSASSLPCGEPAGFWWREQKWLWYCTCAVYHV